jgi:hypothetical protein
MTSQVVITTLPPPTVSHPLDTLSIASSTAIGIDDIRPIPKFLQTKPYQSEIKIVTIYPADKLTLESQNALLKILEEPPAYAKISLYTQNPGQLLPTILSRCELVANPSPIIHPPSSIPPLLSSLSLPPTPAQALAAAAQIKTTRPELLANLETCLQYLACQLLTAPDLVLAYRTGLVLETHTAVSKNANLSLSLSHLFLHWQTPS